MTENHDETGAVLITGGAGFIGTNLAHRILKSGRSVYIYDNLSRPGVEQNVRWLRENHGDRLKVVISDTRNSHSLKSAVQHVTQVFHFAAQVAVTTSLSEPMHDFMVNTYGTLNVLEAIRAAKKRPSLIYTSTNKVYGALNDIKILPIGNQYAPTDPIVRAYGIGEDRPLDFHSPYGCSKGAADQYVIAYARTYSIPAAVFRMSCIYGPHQFGTEDQGWVAHFLTRALERKPVTIYGDGMQVRDVLFIEDLVDAFLQAQKNIQKISGQAFNIGGGPSNTLSLLELVDLINKIQGEKLFTKFENWRVGDQRYYVSDSRKFREATGWTPRVNARQGVAELYSWLTQRKISVSRDPTTARGSEDREILAR